MSASPPRRVDSSPLHTGNKPQPIESGAKRKRVSQEHIDALIIKARADWSEDAKKRALSQSTSSSVREPYSPQLNKHSRIDEDSAESAAPKETTPTYHLPQKDAETSRTLSPETLEYCERLKQKMKEAMEQRQAPAVTALNQKWKMSLGYISNPEHIQ